MSSPDNTIPTKAKFLKAFQTSAQIFETRFTPCGTVLLAACMDSTLRRWRFLDAPPEVAPPVELDPKPKAKTPANAKPSDPHELIELSPIKGFKGWVQTLATHPAEPVVYAADTWGRLGAWDAVTDEPALKWTQPGAHDGWIRQLAVSPKGDKLASCGRDKHVCIWDTRDGKKLADFQHTQDVFCLSFTPDGNQLVFGDFFSKIQVAPTDLSSVVREIDASGLYLLSRMQDVTGLRVLRFSPDGNTLFAAGCKPAGGGFVKGTPNAITFDYASGKAKETTVIGGESDGFFLDLAWHPGGFYIAPLSGQPGSGQIVFVRPGEKTSFFADKSMANCQSVALHPEGKLFVAAGTNKGSSGNGKPSMEGPYLSNHSPLHLFALEV